MKGNLAVQNLMRTTLTVAGLAVLSLPAFAAVVSQATPRVGAAVTQKSGAETRVLPPALQAAFYRSLAKDAGIAYNVNAKGCATLPGAKLTACFSGGGAHFTGASSLALHLVGYGRGGALSPVKAVTPAIEGNRVAYAHGNLTEWWRVLPVGFEQGFTIAKRPAGHGGLTLALATSRQDASAPVRGDLSWGRLHYGDLVVTDANGKVVPATLKSKDSRILIAVNDDHAAYPLTVDPLVWLEQKVTASDGAGSDQFGYTIALQGATALIGASFASVDGNGLQGAVYEFTNSDGVWTQAQKLTVDGATEFGSGVALDGTTALISAPLTTLHGNVWEGTAYMFTESNGTWALAQQLTASDGVQFGTFGQGVALDGNVAFVSAGGASVNGNPVASSVYVFNQSNGTWAQTQEIPSPNPAGDEFGLGSSMAISGTTAIVGAYAATVNGNQVQGNATVYTESGGTWTQTQQLTGADGGAGNYFGVSVSLQGDTVLIGAEGVKGTGAAYIFTNSGGTWAQTQELSANDGASGDAFGSFAAIDGTTAFIGATGYNVGEGKAYIFTNSNGTWSQTQEILPSDQPATGFFGYAGGLSMPTALAGAHGVTVNGNAFQGAAYFYGQSDLGLALSAPQTVGQGQQYVSQTIATNNASAASPAVSATITVPAAASFVSATASQGSCSEVSGVVSCAFGQINGNAGTATANVTLKATGSVGDTIDNTASIALATPPLSASAPTTITSGGACPDGYTEYDGTLNPGEVVRSPVYQAPGGEENAILTAPERFELYAVYQSGRFGRHVYLVPGNEVHRWGPKGLYMWLVRARDGSGAYTLCLQHP